MKKKLLLPALVLIVVLLAGCAPQGSPEVNIPTLGSQAPQPNPMKVEASTAPVNEPIVTLPEGIDPSAEEDSGDDVELIGPAAQQPAGQQTQKQEQNFFAASGTDNPYAGSSPIPLNPIDMPTPPPRPKLTFTYQTYTASRLGLTFESAAGYEVDESAGDAFILREPASMWKDNKGVVITLSQASVSSAYTKNDVRKDLVTKLDDMGQAYKEWRPSNTAERALLRAPGYYANYRAVMMDGTIVRGRIHMALLGNRVITLQIEHPGEYNEEYTELHSHIRSTLKEI